MCLPGYGLRCHRAIKEIAMLLGIQDMRCKVQGPTTPLSLVRAAFQGLLSQVMMALESCMRDTRARVLC